MELRITGDHLLEILIRANEQHPRIGEGDMIVLRDGKLLLAYTEFYEGASDFSPARIVARISEDNGVTWSEPFVIQENVGKCNVMSVSLLRLNSGEIAFFYAVKNSYEDCRFYIKKSSDEGETWSRPVLVTVDEGYFVMNNDRAVQLSSGRIIAPVATYQDLTTHSYWKSFIYYSDDGGETWLRSKGEVKLKRVDSPAGLQEPGIVELKDGRLLMYMRTALGYIYASYSEDEGETWSEPKPLNGIKAPLAPASIKRIPTTGDLLLVWNDKSEFDLRELKRRKADIVDPEFQKRTPLSCAISRDEGETWRKVLDLEERKECTYCYTSITFKEDFIFFTYYYREGDGFRNGYSHLKIKRLLVKNLYSKLG